VLGIIVNVYDNNSFIPMDEYYGEKLYYAVWYIISLLPMVYALIKEKSIKSKISTIVVGIALIPYLLYMFTSLRLPTFASIIFTLALMGFFITSAIDTSDKPTRYIAAFAGVGAFILLLRAVKDIVYFSCDKPEINSFIINNSRTFSYILFIGCILMALYFLYILKRSKFTLKSICISAVIACVLIWTVDNLYNIIYNISVCDILYPALILIIYISFVYTFYKLQKKL
jgi:hypothetical protein